MSDCAAITGFGAICALGENVDAISAALWKSPPDPISAHELHPEALSFPFFQAPLQNRRHSARDTYALALRAAKEATAMAGWTNMQGCAVIVGTTSGTALHFLESYRKGEMLADGEDYLRFNTAQALATELGATGARLTLSNACVSGADAIGLGADLISTGAVNRVLCGGADAFSLVAHTGFATLKLQSDERCRPFDAKRKGLNLGEGAAFLCLEKSGAKPFGHILGYGCSNDAWHLTSPHPEGAGLRDAIRDALSRGRRSLENLAFVNAHGTATLENDKVEGNVISKELPGIPVWASKGATGHTLGAAGALEAVLALIALKAGKIPASPGFKETDPAIGTSPCMIEQQLSETAAISLSLGFGGGNSAILLGVS